MNKINETVFKQSIRYLYGYYKLTFHELPLEIQEILLKLGYSKYEFPIYYKNKTSEPMIIYGRIDKSASGLSLKEVTFTNGIAEKCRILNSINEADISDSTLLVKYKAFTENDRQEVIRMISRGFSEMPIEFVRM